MESKKSDLVLFFDNVRDGNLYLIEIENEIQRLTNNYNIDKLNMLLSGFRNYYREMVDKELSKYTDEQLEDLIDDNKKSGKDEPMIRLRSKVEESKDQESDKTQEYVKLLFPENYLDPCLNFMKLLSKTIEKNSADVFIDKKSKSKKNHKEEAWFVVGVLIATGEINNLKKQFTSSTQIADHLFKDKSTKYRPWLSSSINGETTGQKSIYAYPAKLKKIHEHCIKENITMTDEFLKCINAL